MHPAPQEETDDRVAALCVIARKVVQMIAAVSLLSPKEQWERKLRDPEVAKEALARRQRRKQQHQEEDAARQRAQTEHTWKDQANGGGIYCAK